MKVNAKKVKKILNFVISKKYLIIAVALLLILLIVIFSAMSKAKKKKIEEANAVKGCTYSFEGFDGVSDVDIINDTLVYYKNADGKYGLMKFDGTITEKAQQDKIYAIEDEWHHYRYVCEGPLSEYRLLIDTEAAKITPKQYHGIISPEKEPVWDTVKQELAWKNKDGTLEKVKSSELSLDEGLYPVKSFNSKAENTNGTQFGYIDNSLMLDIALVYDDAKDFSCGLAAVKSGGKWGYINSDGIKKIPMSYSDCRAFKNSLAVVSRDGKWGIIDTTGETVVEFGFEYLLQGEKGKYIGKRDGKWCVVTLNKDTLEAVKATETTTAPGIQLNGGAYVVTTAGSSLNMRNGASVSAPVIAQIPNGTTITVLEAVPGWAKAKYLSYTGWVSADYITEIITESETASDITPSTEG